VSGVANGGGDEMTKWRRLSAARRQIAMPTEVASPGCDAVEVAAPGWRQPVVEVLEWKWRYQDVIFWIPELPLLAYGASGTRSGSIRLFHSSPGVLPCPSNLRRLLSSGFSCVPWKRINQDIGLELKIS